MSDDKILELSFDFDSHSREKPVADKTPPAPSTKKRRVRKQVKAPKPLPNKRGKRVSCDTDSKRPESEKGGDVVSGGLYDLDVCADDRNRDGGAEDRKVAFKGEVEVKLIETKEEVAEMEDGSLGAGLSELRRERDKAPGASKFPVEVRMEGSDLVVERVLKAGRDHTSVGEVHFRYPLKGVYGVETRVEPPNTWLVLHHNKGAFRVGTTLTEAGYALLAVRLILKHFKRGQ